MKLFLQKGVILLALMCVYGTSLLPQETSAAELYNEYHETLHGEVLEIISEEDREIPGTDTTQTVQTIRVKVLNEEQKGAILTFENDFRHLEVGDRFYFNHFVYMDNSEYYSVINIDRRVSLYSLVIFFIFLVLLFGGWQGARSILALAGSFFAIFFVLIPGLLNGWNPIFISILVATAVLFGAIFFTHGFNKESLVAYVGTLLSVCITSLFALYAVEITDLTGFASDEATYLNFNTKGTLDFASLLIGAIIIGILGVLDDIAITQAAVVTELYNTNNSLGYADVYRKAIRVGKEHVGALVNTLVLAYTGASLPLLLYVYLLPTGFSEAVNLEIFATEIVRTVVGSFGLVLAVPIVTALAAYYLKDYKPKHVHKHTH